MRFLLDTDTASFIIKGRSPAIRKTLQTISPDDIAISAVTAAELRYGLKRLPPEHRLHMLVAEFLKTIVVLPWTDSAAVWYAEIRHQLTASGQPIGELDMMIAAHALDVGATLVTNNLRHYERIKAPLRFCSWAD
ncbi:MAG: type II toxin-antitoxin system VapC family toxin [Azoarcus sp.]|jgi:tRNA(fMet)-specific endonuclease VapC|nr:type II toxin-antitoxin system VapC family toxin [Azoarcus sp.]